MRNRQGRDVVHADNTLKRAQPDGILLLPWFGLRFRDLVLVHQVDDLVFGLSFSFRGLVKDYRRLERFYLGVGPT